MAYTGFQRGECLRSGPIRKVGVQSTSGPIKWGGGGGGWGAVHFKSDLRKVGGGGGVPDPIPLFGTQKIRYR